MIVKPVHHLLAVSVNTPTHPEKKTGRQAFRAPNQRLESRFCRWAAGQRLAEKEESSRGGDSGWVFITGGCSGRGVQWMGVVWYYIVKQPIVSCKPLHPVSTAPPFDEPWLECEASAPGPRRAPRRADRRTRRGPPARHLGLRGVGAEARVPDSLRSVFESRGFKSSFRPWGFEFLLRKMADLLRIGS